MSEEGGFRPDAGLIAGIVIVIVLAVVLVIAALCFLLRMRRHNYTPEPQKGPPKRPENGLVTSADEWVVSYRPDGGDDVTEKPASAPVGNTMQLNIEHLETKSLESYSSVKDMYAVPNKRPGSQKSQDSSDVRRRDYVKMPARPGKPVLTLPPRLHTQLGRTVTVSGVPTQRDRPRLYQRHLARRPPSANQRPGSANQRPASTNQRPASAVRSIYDTPFSREEIDTVSFRSATSGVSTQSAPRGILKHSGKGRGARTWGPGRAQGWLRRQTQRQLPGGQYVPMPITVTPRRLWKYYFAGNKTPDMNNNRKKYKVGEEDTASEKL